MKPQKVCATCNHKSSRHDILRLNGQRVCLRLLCPCTDFVEKNPESAVQAYILSMEAAMKNQETYASPVTEETFLTIAKRLDEEWRKRITTSAAQKTRVLQNAAPGNKKDTLEILDGIQAQQLFQGAVESPYKETGVKKVILNNPNVEAADPSLDRISLKPGDTVLHNGVKTTIGKQYTRSSEETLKDNDPVNHPSHYTAYKGIEIIQLTRQMNFNRGNAVKYITRAGLKDKATEEQDLEKAIWYLQDELKFLRGEV